jgi:hypothetical protein
VARLTKSTAIDGIASVETRDSQGEVLALDGADISQMTKRGYFNDNHQTGFANTLGRITFAKKIFKENDIGSPREREYWNKVKKPFLYVKGFLFDEEDHPNAKAVASIMREFQKMGTPLDVQMSVEGKVLNRGQDGLIKESMIRNVALTLVPANSSTGAQILSEDARQAILHKCKADGANVEYADTLMKSLSVEALPLQRKFIEVKDDAQDPYGRVFKNVQEIQKRIKMVKMLSVGYGTAGAPASRVDGATLVGEKTGKKLTSNTFSGKDVGKEKRQRVLKSLIRKVKEQNLKMSYNDIVEKALEVFYNKFYKKEK